MVNCTNRIAIKECVCELQTVSHRAGVMTGYTLRMFNHGCCRYVNDIRVVGEETRGSWVTTAGCWGENLTFGWPSRHNDVRLAASAIRGRSVVAMWVLDSATVAKMERSNSFKFNRRSIHVQSKFNPSSILDSIAYKQTGSWVHECDEHSNEKQSCKTILMSQKCNDISKWLARHKCRYTKETVSTDDGTLFRGIEQRRQHSQVGSSRQRRCRSSVWRTISTRDNTRPYVNSGDTRLEDNQTSCFRATHAR